MSDVEFKKKCLKHRVENIIKEASNSYSRKTLHFSNLELKSIFTTYSYLFGFEIRRVHTTHVDVNLVDVDTWQNASKNIDSIVDEIYLGQKAENKFWLSVILSLIVLVCLVILYFYLR